MQATLGIRHRTKKKTQHGKLKRMSNTDPTSDVNLRVGEAQTVLVSYETHACMVKFYSYCETAFINL